MKKSCPAWQGYPTYRGETTRPTELSRPPRRVRVLNVNGWLEFGKKQAKRYLGQGNSGGGLSRVPETIQMGPKTIIHLSVGESGGYLPSREAAR